MNIKERKKKRDINRLKNEHKHITMYVHGYFGVVVFCQKGYLYVLSVVFATH